MLTLRRSCVSPRGIDHACDEPFQVDPSPAIEAEAYDHKVVVRNEDDVLALEARGHGDVWIEPREAPLLLGRVGGGFGVKPPMRAVGSLVLGRRRAYGVVDPGTVEERTSRDAAAVEVLRAAAEEKRAVAYEQVRKTLMSRRYAKMMFHLTAFVAVEGWLAMPLDPSDPLLRPLEICAGDILAKPHRKLLKQAEKLEGQDMEARHEVRIRIKKLRYAVDFLRGVYPGKQTSKYVKSLQSLQDQFGHLNDVAQAMHMTGVLTASDDPDQERRLALAGGLIQGWYARALKETEPQLLKDWKTFAKVQPFWLAPPASRDAKGKS